MRKALITLYLVFVSVLGTFAQSNYPIYVSPTLIPPYSLKLSDYSKFGSQQIIVNIVVNDLNIANLPVKLRIKLETVGVTIENPPTLNTTPIYLDGGAAIVLSGDDLKDYFNINNLIFKGYSKEAYKRSGQLPEGFYKITVEVLHFQTNRLISNQGSATAWIALGKPPVLKLPENNKEMGEFKGMPIVFSWLPSNVGSPVSANSIQYKFEMWEMRVEGINPYTIASSTPVFHEVTTQNTNLSLYPSSLLMEPGMKYAWRITASDLSGYVPFEQDGHSEIRVFTYKSRCDSVTDLSGENRAKNGIFKWTPRENHTSFNVEMRNPVTGWSLNSQANDSKAEFSDLDYGAKYELRVQAVCDGDPESVSDFSHWETLIVPQKRINADSAACPTCKCDNNLGAGDVANIELKKDLKPGDTIVNRFGTTRFIVKSVEQQSDGVYKGQFLFWSELWKLKFICNYWDLSVNTNKVIVNMDYESVYNPQYLLDVDATTAYLDKLAGAITTLTVNATIKDTISVNETITSIYVNAGDSLIAVTVGPNGELHEVVIQHDTKDIEKTMVKGANGEEYVVNRDGEVMGVKEYQNTGGGNNRMMNDYIKKNESEHLSSSTEVKFSASPNQKYGFDAFSAEKQALAGNYPSLQNGYQPAYKSVASFSPDKVLSSGSGSGIKYRDEMGIPAIVSGNELTLRGGTDGSVTALYAYKAVNDTTEEIAGKLNIMSYDEQTKKVYIIPVNNAHMPAASELQKVLNTVYAQAVTKWEVVKIDKDIQVTFENGNMTHGGSNAISVYNADQKSVISKFKETDNFEKGALYLFFVDNVQSKTDDIAGFMPLQRQVGFIYDNPNEYIIAHELAHGAFNLRHTFSTEKLIAQKGSTKNLMDYNSGTELWKHQWNFIHDPQTILFAWAQSEDEGEGKNLCLSSKSINDFQDIFTTDQELEIDSKIKNFHDYTGLNAFVVAPSITLPDEKIFEVYMNWEKCSEKGVLFLINTKTPGNWSRDFKIKSNQSSPAVKDVNFNLALTKATDELNKKNYSAGMLNAIDGLKISLAPKDLYVKCGSKKFRNNEIILFDVNNNNVVKLEPNFKDDYINIQKDLFNWEVGAGLKNNIAKDDKSILEVDLSTLTETEPKTVKLKYDNTDEITLILSKLKVQFSRAEEGEQNGTGATIDEFIYLYDNNEKDEWAEFGHHIVIPMGQETYFRFSCIDLNLVEFVDDKNLIKVEKSKIIKDNTSGPDIYLMKMSSISGQGKTVLKVRLKGTSVNIALLDVHVVPYVNMGKRHIYQIYDSNHGMTAPTAITTNGDAKKIFQKIGYVLEDLVATPTDIAYDINADQQLNYFLNTTVAGDNYEFDKLNTSIPGGINKDVTLICDPVQSYFLKEEASRGDSKIYIDDLGMRPGYYSINNPVTKQKEIIKFSGAEHEMDLMVEATITSPVTRNYSTGDYIMTPKGETVINSTANSDLKLYVTGSLPELEKIWKFELTRDDGTKTEIKVNSITHYIDRPDESVLILKDAISKDFYNYKGVVKLTYYVKEELKFKIKKNTTKISYSFKKSGYYFLSTGEWVISDGKNMETIDVTSSKTLGVPRIIANVVTSGSESPLNIGYTYSISPDITKNSYVTKGISKTDAEGAKITESYTAPGGFTSKDGNLPIFMKFDNGNIDLVYAHEFGHNNIIYNGQNLSDLENSPKNIMNFTIVSPSNSLFRLPYTLVPQQIHEKQPSSTPKYQNQWLILFKTNN